MSRDRQTIRSYRRTARVTLVALLALFAFDAAWTEDLYDGDWQLDTYVELSGSTTYLVENGNGTALPAVGAEIGVDLSSPDRPIAGGLFASYERETTPRGEALLATGGWARYRYLRWEVITTVAFVETGSSGDFWMHASKLRFRPRPGHKLAIEALGVFGDSSKPALQFSYGVNLPRNVSLTFGLGFGSNRLFDLAGNAKVVWSLY